MYTVGNEDNPTIKHQKVVKKQDPKSPSGAPTILEDSPVKAKDTEQLESSYLLGFRSVLTQVLPFVISLF